MERAATSALLAQIDTFVMGGKKTVLLLAVASRRLVSAGFSAFNFNTVTSRRQIKYPQTLNQPLTR